MEKSEELAKLLKIKPKYPDSAGNTQEEREINWLWNYEYTLKESEREPTIYRIERNGTTTICCHSCGTGSFERRIYPDFTKPSNFVKLLNLVYKCGINQKYDFQLASMSFEEDNNSIWLGEIEEIIKNFETVWIECLFTSLQKSNPDSWDKLFTKKIQQQAQQTDWEY